MKRTATRLGLSAVCTLIFTAACASFPHDLAQAVARRWEAPSAAAGLRLIDEYGTPDDVTPNKLTWNERGEWKKTVVWNRKTVYASPTDLAVMEQTVDYPLTHDEAAELLAFSPALKIDLAKGEISSRASREELDYLNLNLADDVVRGRKTVAQARASFDRQVELAAAGKVMPDMRGLRFLPSGIPKRTD